MMPFCSNCGSQYNFGVGKCPKCDKELPQLKPTSQLDKSKSIKEQNSKKERLKTIPAAPIPKRIAAGFFDILIGLGLMFFIIRVILLRYILKRAMVRGLLSFLIIYALAALYFILRDSLKGKSFGKLIFGLSTINWERGKQADLADSILRNSLLGSIVIPGFGWIVFSFISVIITIQILLGKEYRLGDSFAHTKVIEDKFLEEIIFE